MVKAHTPINWENKPSVNTPINETNLNKMDSTIGILDDRIIEQDTSKLDKSTAYTMVKDISFNDNNGVFTVTRLNGSTFTIDTRLEKIAINFKYDYYTQKLIVTLIDGTTQSIDMSALLTQYEFTDSDTIGWEVTTDGTVKAKVFDGSITEDMLQPNYLAEIKVETAKSESYMNSAKTSENNAKQSELNAKASEEKALEYSNNAQPLAQSVSGENPTITNSTNAPLIYLKNSGYTEQDTSGINLFDAISVYNEKDGYSVSDDGTITATVTDDVREWKYTNCECKMTLSSGTYHIKLLNDSVTEHEYAGFYVILTDDTLYRGSDYKAMWNTEYTFTLTEDTDIGIMIKPFTNTFKVMLTKDIDITEYEPYCGGVASPNPNYPKDIVGLGDSGSIEVRTCGKNLLSHRIMSGTEYGLTRELNDDGSLTFIGTTTNQITYHLDDIISRLKVGETYIWSGVTHVRIVEGGTSLYKSGYGSYTITENTTAFIPYFQWNSVGITLNTTFYPMVRIKGTDDTYEPYTETVATIPIDTLYEGDYLEVYADGSGKIVRENKTLVLDEKQNYEHMAEWTNESAFQWDGSISDAVYVNGFYTKANLKCSHLPINTPGYISATSGISAIGQGHYEIYLSINGITTVAGLREYLTENPITVIYKLATPIETPLTAKQVEQFKKLYTFDNVTNFFCDGEITARYYCNTDSGDTVGMIQETVDGLQKTVKEIPDTYTTQSDFDRIVGGTVSDSGLTNVSYIVPNEISDGSMSFGSYTSGTLVDALRKATNQITMFLGTLFEEGDKSVVFENDSVAGTLEVFRHKLSEGTYLLDIKVTITSITETLSGNGPSVDLTLQDIGFEDNIIAIRESECLLASYYPLIVNGSSYCLGGGMVSTENSTKGFYLRFLPHKNTKGSISSNNKSVLSGTMMIKVVEQQL